MASATMNRGFSGREIALAWASAFVVQFAFFALLVWAGKSEAHVQAVEEPKPELVPIAVQPVLDDLPLLKLGSKNKVKPKLPEIWKKQEPTPVKRFEERSAPSTKADDKKTTELPTSELADKDHAPPPPDAELAKEADPTLEDSDKKDAPEMNEEGAPDGSKDGTETDPLKANAVNLYRSRIAAWFNARFRAPADTIPCEELKKLSASVAVQVGGDRSVRGFTITSPSGNATFDARVESTLRGLVGQELPPPPPLYPDILGAVVTPRLSGAGACQ